jgi:hypothetical protein
MTRHLALDDEVDRIMRKGRSGHTLMHSVDDAIRTRSSSVMLLADPDSLGKQAITEPTPQECRTTRSRMGGMTLKVKVISDEAFDLGDGGRIIRTDQAIRGEYPAAEHRPVTGAALGGWRQGFLSNITNPKVLVFYLAVLPQFVSGGAGTPVLLVFALSHALLSLLYLLVLTTFLHKARGVLTRRRVRRGLDAATGTALLRFSVRLAAEH